MGQHALLRAAAAVVRRSFLCFLVCLALFLALPQRVPHSMDTHFFVVWLEQGHQEYPRHPLYMQLARFMYQILLLPGARPYTALLVLSAVSAAAGLAFASAAAKRLVGFAQSEVLLPLGLVCVPSLFYFATAAEIGGVASGASGLAWWSFARFGERRTYSAAVILGLCTGLSAGVHAFGHLLLPMFVIAATVLRLAPSGARLVPLVLAATTHGLVALLAAVVSGVGARGQAVDAWQHLLERFDTLDLSKTAIVFWREWLLSYAPWSLIAIVGLFAKRSRAFALITLLFVVLHLPLSVLLLGSIGADEDGMYFLSLAVPAVVTALQLLAGRTLFAAMTLGARLRVALAKPHWPQPGSVGFCEGLQTLRTEGNFVLVATTKERDAARSRVAEVVILELDRLLGFYLLAQREGKTPKQWFSELMTKQEMPILFTKEAAAILSNYGPPFEGLWSLIERDYSVEPVQRIDFYGCFIRPH
ncbi:MAG: hypothetical protein WCR59_01135 [Planctomycetota bacterium]